MSCGNNRRRPRLAAASLLLLMLWSSLADAKSTKSTKKEAKESSKRSSSNDPYVCDPDKLLVYRVTLSTHWSRTNFPKQYPEWRPPAQWSKMIGNLSSIFFLLLVICSMGSIQSSFQDVFNSINLKLVFQAGLSDWCWYHLLHSSLWTHFFFCYETYFFHNFVMLVPIFDEFLR